MAVSVARRDLSGEGETRVVDIDGMRVVVRFVGRKGRRGGSQSRRRRGRSFHRRVRRRPTGVEPGDRRRAAG